MGLLIQIDKKCLKAHFNSVSVNVRVRFELHDLSGKRERVNGNFWLVQHLATSCQAFLRGVGAASMAPIRL